MPSLESGEHAKVYETRLRGGIQFNTNGKVGNNELTEIDVKEIPFDSIGGVASQSVLETSLEIQELQINRLHDPIEMSELCLSHCYLDLSAA